MTEVCEHNWVFLERWVSESNNPRETVYVFYCSRCLETESIQLEGVRK